MRRLILLLICLLFATQPSIRAAIDVGSGGPKLRIAEVDPCSNKILKILHVKQYPVFFQDAFRDGNRSLSERHMRQGLEAIKAAIGLAYAHHAEKIVLIGASAFRNASNGEMFARSIQLETGHVFHILDQLLEGKLAFQAALAQLDITPENLTVWDIGGGSTQMVTVTEEGSYLIDSNDEGSGPFRDFLIETLKGMNVKECRTPNPISIELAQRAEQHARSLALKVLPYFKNKAQDPKNIIVGAGSLFGRGISRLMGGKTHISLEELSQATYSLMGKSDADLGGGDFACIEVSNPLLVLGLMKGLGIKELHLIDVNNADGALLYKPFWE